jgi:tRNA dimethylallyltransferase
MSSKYNLVTILGPTASGKTAFAARLAHRINGEVISADSRQVYRKMDIGTGKDYADYIVDNIQVPFHLTDLADPGDHYNVFEFQRDFNRVFNDILLRGKFPVLCGGSGMYIDAATRSYKLHKVPFNHILRENLKQKSLEELGKLLSDLKVLHNNTDTDTIEHALSAIEIAVYYRDNKLESIDLQQINTLYTGIIFDRSVERLRITKRLYERLKHGLVEEVQQLLDSGISPESLSYYGLEYRFITEYLTGKINYDDMVSLLNTAIHQFAKRQRTWFRKMEREGCVIHWFDGEKPAEEHIAGILELLNC